MILISHRGNINSINKDSENSHKYIDKAIELGYQVEIDIWQRGNSLYLGHDCPQYIVDLNFLIIRRDFLWIHTKNFEALNYLIDKNLRLFFHEKEKHTIIANTNNIWSHELSEASFRSIIPLLSKTDMLECKKYSHVYGICSDFVGIDTE